jgi:hypothetical protein
MMTDRERLDRGARAKAFMDDELMVEAFSEIRRRYIDEWEKTPVRDSEAREKIWIMLKLLDKVKGHLEQVVADGKIAEKEIAALEKRKLFGLV